MQIYALRKYDFPVYMYVIYIYIFIQIYVWNHWNLFECNNFTMKPYHIWYFFFAPVATAMPGYCRMAGDFMDQKFGRQWGWQPIEDHEMSKFIDYVVVSNIFFWFTPIFWGNDPIWRVAFKWGANHQPVERNMTCFKMFWHWICVFLDTPKMPCMSMRMKAMEIKICQLPSTDSGRNLSFNRWLLQASVLPNTFASWSVAFVFFDLEIFLHHFKVTLICLIFWCSWYWFHLIYHLIYH